MSSAILTPRRFLFKSFLLYFVFSVFFLIPVSAEGLLPSRDRHRAQALQAVKQHYKRQFVNDTTSATSTESTSTSGTSTSPSSSPDTSLQNFLTNLFNSSNSNSATETATGVLGPAVFVGGTTSNTGQRLSQGKTDLQNQPQF